MQPLKIRYDWKFNDNFRLREMSFDVLNDIIDFGCVPELCDYHVQNRTLLGRNPRTYGEQRQQYYDHWSDDFMRMEYN